MSARKARAKPRKAPSRPAAAVTLDQVDNLAVRAGLGSSTVLRALGYDRREEFPGHAAIDAAGATLARDMLEEMEGVNDDGTADADDCSLENWTREGRPFRNVVAEYAAQARAAGPQALEAFYAVLSDFISIVCQGNVPDGRNYDRFCASKEDAGPVGESAP